MAGKKKKDNSDAIVLLIFMGALGILIAASILFQNKSGPIQGTGFAGSESVHEYKDYTWIILTLLGFLCVGIIWSIIRLIKNATIKKETKKVSMSKEEREREELIQAARDVAQKRQKERELLKRNQHREYDEEYERRWDMMEDEEESQEEEGEGKQALGKIHVYWEAFKRMPIQGKVVIVGAASAVVAGFVWIVRTLFR